MVADPNDALNEIETFVTWLGRASALQDVFPDYVLSDSHDYADALQEIERRVGMVIDTARELNPSIANQISVCLGGEVDYPAAAIACQRLLLLLEKQAKNV